MKLSKNECNVIMSKILHFLACGQRITKIEYPNYGEIDVEIISIKLDNILFYPIKVSILTKLWITKEYKSDEYEFMSDEPIMKKHKVRFTETECQLDWFTTFLK